MHHFPAISESRLRPGSYRHGPAALFRRAMQVRRRRSLGVRFARRQRRMTRSEAIQENRDALEAEDDPLLPGLCRGDEQSRSAHRSIPWPCSSPRTSSGRDHRRVHGGGRDPGRARYARKAAGGASTFPMGNWTDLRGNKVYPGRQRIEIEAAPDEMPLFVRNGSILPMEGEAAAGPMILHYLPKLAAEFFLYEPDVRRVHAAARRTRPGSDTAGDQRQRRRAPASGSFTTCRPPARCRPGRRPAWK